MFSSVAGRSSPERLTGRLIRPLLSLKRAALAFAVLLISALLLFWPGFSWSASTHHWARRVVVKAEMKFSELRGNPPRLLSLSAESDVPAAEIQALDSHSGLACLADGQGRFVLPDVTWYPGARYDLVATTDGRRGRCLTVDSPYTYPEGGTLRLVNVDFAGGRVVDLAHLPGNNSISYEDYDADNDLFYKQLFDSLTIDRTSDEDRMLAINSYVASKLNYDRSTVKPGSPRKILEEGSEYCGNLTAAMATLLAARDYIVRRIDMSDGGVPPATHAVVEVFYDGGWHLFDPTFGVVYKNSEGKIASYQDLRLKAELISPDVFS